MVVENDYTPEQNVPWLTEYDVDFILNHDISEQFGALSTVFLSKLEGVGLSMSALSDEFGKAGAKAYERWIQRQCAKARDAAPCEDGIKVVEACASDDLKDMCRKIRPAAHP